MTPKQRKFADEYLIDLNATRAYRSAYTHIKNNDVAQAAGSRLLSNVMVKKYVDEQLEKMNSEKIANVQEVMEYLTAVMRGTSKAEIVVVEGMGEGCSAARRMDKSPDEKERLKAAELLGKRYRMFTDNINLDGGVAVIFSGEDKLEE